MARPKKETYSRQEVDLMLNGVMAITLAQINHSLLSSKAEPSGEIGKLIMGYAQGNCHFNDEAMRIAKELMLEGERAAQIQGIINGFGK